MNAALQVIIDLVQYFVTNIGSLIEWLTQPILEMLPGWLQTILEPVLSTFHIENISPFRLVLDGLVIVFIIRLINKFK